jgi:hypothetical protein
MIPPFGPDPEEGGGMKFLDDGGEGEYERERERLNGVPQAVRINTNSDVRKSLLPARPPC